MSYDRTQPVFRQSFKMLFMFRNHKYGKLLKSSFKFNYKKVQILDKRQCYNKIKSNIKLIIIYKQNSTIQYYRIENSQFLNMNLKQSRLKAAEGSPICLITPEETSQMSLNQSYLKKEVKQKNEKQTIDNNKTKKRLKFDTILQKGVDDLTNNIVLVDTEEDFEVQLHISNALRRISQFLRGQHFSYLNIFMLAIFLINCTLQAAEINESGTGVIQKIDLALQIFFSLTIIVKFTHYEDQHLFWIILDLITNLCGYLAFGLNNSEASRYFKAVKTVRLLIIAKQSKYLQVPAGKLINSLSSVGKILFPAAMFIYLYAVIGLYSFRDYEYTKCRDPANKLKTQNWTVYSESIFLCGQKSCPVVEGIQFQCLNPIDYGVQPDPSQVKNIMQGYGLMKYNNIFYSLFSTFKQTFITGSSRLMILGKQVTNYFYVLIYYLSFIYLLAYIYLNIFYGLMITNEEESQQGIRRESSFVLKLQRANSKRTTNKDQTQVEDKQANQGKQIPDSQFKQQKSPIKSPVGFKKTMRNADECLDEIDQKANEQRSQFDEVIDLNNKDQDFLEEANNTGKLKLQSKMSIFSKQDQQQFPNTFSNNKSQKDQKYIGTEQDEQKLVKYTEIVKKYYFVNHLIVILCSVNILVDYEGQTYNAKLIVDCIDFSFYWVYMAEVIFRLVVHFKYIPNQPFDRSTKLDFVLFFMCTCGLVYQVATALNIHHFLMASDDLSRLLRTIKYLRIFLLISSTPYFNQAKIIFNSTLEAVYSVRFFSTIWLLVLIIFSIMGYHMFKGKTKVDDHGHLDLQNGQSRSIGFQGIGDSIIFTVFIFFNEQWDWFIFEQYVGENAWIVIWQLFVLVVGLQVLSKYFMALLMKQLGEKLNQQDSLTQQNQMQMIADQIQELTIIQNTNSNKISPITRESKKLEKIDFFSLKLKTKQTLKDQQAVKKPVLKSKISINVMAGLVQIKNSPSQQLQAERQKQARDSAIRDMILGGRSPSNQTNSKDNKFEKFQARQKEQINGQISLQDEISSFQSPFSSLAQTRIKLMIMFKSKVYICTRVIFILISIVCTLGMHPYKDPNSQQIKAYQKVWYVTVAFFGLEIIMSIFTFGLFTQKNGYFRNIMNWMYLFVFVIEIIDVIPGFFEAYQIKYLLSLRVLRIFAFIELKYEADSDMRLTIVSFWKLMPKVLNLLAITITMYGFFAIILVKLYKDDFFYCDGFQENATIITSEDCMNWGGSWVQRKMNVSNILKSLLYLFLIATTEGWSTQVIEAAGLTGQGNEPIYGKNVWLQYFFSVFFFFGNMIMLNVFIGLSVYNFQKIKSQVTGLARLSKDSKVWFSIKNTIHRLKPKMKDTPPQNQVSKLTHKFKNSSAYKVINVILFVLFMINMSLYTTNMASKKQQILQTILQIFIGIFIFEYVIRWISLGLRTIRQPAFAFQTVGIIYFIVLFILKNSVQIEPKIQRIMHGIAICFLAIRYFTLLNEIQFIKKMINSLVSIFPQTSNIWLLMFVTLFTYAVIGIYFFGYLKVSPELNEFDQNYSDLPSSIYALIKFSTLQSPILQILDATSSIQPNSVCFEIFNYQDFIKYGRMGCGNKVAAYLFFLSFHLIYSLILLSTLLAVIVDAYSQVRREQESMVNKFQLEEVLKQWQNYDPQATGYISYRDFWLFTAKIVKIYKVNNEQLLSHETKQSFLKSLNIAIYEDQNGVLSFQFHQVVQALTRIVVKQKMGGDWDTTEADKVFKNHHNNISDFKLMKKSFYNSSHVLSLIVIKSGLKTWKRKAVKTQNNQNNLQNLFTFAKKQKQKIQINNNIMNQYGNINPNITDLKQDREIEGLAQQKANSIKKDDGWGDLPLEKDNKQKSYQIDFDISGKQKSAQKFQKVQISIQRASNQQGQAKINLAQGWKGQFFQSKQSANKNAAIQVRKTESVKQNTSKIRSPREGSIKNLYSQRAKQLPHSRIQEKDQDEISDLQKIEQDNHQFAGLTYRFQSTQD